MVLEKEGDRFRKSKLQAILYILAMFIYKEKTNQQTAIADLNRSLYSDRALVKMFLSLTLPRDKKLSKFYGTIMIHLTLQDNSKKIKELILSNILLNFGKIEHEPTFFNLLVYLRS